MDNDTAVDAYNVLRFAAADLCDVAAQRTALLTRIGDTWSTTAHRLRDENARWMLYDHTTQWVSYAKMVNQPLGPFAEGLAAAALLQHLGLHDFISDFAAPDSFVVQSAGATYAYVVSPALCTMACSAVATTVAGWNPERDSALAAEAAASGIGVAMAAAVSRVNVTTGRIRGRAPLIGAAVLAARRILDDPDDGALLANIELDVRAILPRMSDPA